MELLKKIIKVLDERSAQDIRIYEANSPIFEYMVVATASSERLLDALTTYVKETCEEAGFDYRGVEKSETWNLIDCRNVVINIFTEESRNYYGLDKLYLGSNQIDVSKLLNGDL